MLLIELSIIVVCFKNTIEIEICQSLFIQISTTERAWEGEFE